MRIYVYYIERERAQWTSIPPKIFLQDISPSLWMAGHCLGQRLHLLQLDLNPTIKNPFLDLKWHSFLVWTTQIFNSDNKQNVFQNNKQFQKHMVQVRVLYIYIDYEWLWLLDATKLINILLPVSTLKMFTFFLTHMKFTHSYPCLPYIHGGCHC